MGGLIRRLRAENRLPMTQGSVLGRIDRCGTKSIGELASAERVRPQSMAQTIADLEEAGLVSRTPDPADGRRVLIDMTEAGRQALTEDRELRDGWIAAALDERFDAEERAVIAEAVELLERLVEEQ